MSPWEMKVGQTVGYKHRGPLWRAKVSAIERDGKINFAEIPIVDEQGLPILYEDPPAFANPIIDFENYFLVEDVDGRHTEPWLAARLDHQDLVQAWKALAEKVGLREPFYSALASVMQRWAPPERRGDLLDDLLVLFHAAWRAGAGAENAEIAKMLDKRCADRGVVCQAHCTHPEDIEAVKARMGGPL